VLSLMARITARSSFKIDIHDHQWSNLFGLLEVIENFMFYSAVDLKRPVRPKDRRRFCVCSSAAVLLLHASSPRGKPHVSLFLVVCVCMQDFGVHLGSDGESPDLTLAQRVIQLLDLYVSACSPSFSLSLLARSLIACLTSPYRYHTPPPFSLCSLKSGSHWASDAYVEATDQKRAVEISKRLEEESAFFRDVLAYLTALPTAAQKSDQPAENKLPPALLQRLSVTLQARKNRYSAQQVSLWDGTYVRARDGDGHGHEERWRYVWVGRASNAMGCDGMRCGCD
jgi:hypothetical protein